METILHLAAFNYFIDLTNKIDKNAFLMVFYLSLALMIRVTSPIPWIPLLLIKLITERPIVSYLLSGIIIAIPTVMLCILADSIYYG
jgi:hypothetical protein